MKAKGVSVKIPLESKNLRPHPHVSRCFLILNFFSAHLASNHIYLMNLADKFATFLIYSPEWKLLNTLWIQNRLDKKKKILADFYYVFKTNPRGLNLNFCNSIITVQFFLLLILLCFQDKSIQDYDIKLTYFLQTTHRQLKYLAISLQSPDEFSPKPHIKSASKA